MAINAVTNGDNITRTNTTFDPALDWTRSFWIRRGASTPSGGNSRTFWVYGDIASYINPWMWIGSAVASNNIEAQLYDGATTTTLTGPALTSGEWYYVTLTYTASTTSIKLYLNSTLIDSDTVDLSTFVFVETDEDIGPDGWGDTSFSLERIWQRVLSTAQMEEEAGSLTPILNTNLISATGLQTITDLTDQFGQNWTANGSLTTFSGPAIIFLSQQFFSDPAESASLHGVINWIPTNAAGTVVIKRCSGTGCSVANVATGISSTLGYWIDTSITEGGIFRYQIEITVAGQGVWLSSIYTVTWGISQTDIVYDVPGLAGTTIPGAILAPTSGQKSIVLGAIVDDSQVPIWAECIRLQIKTLFHTSAGVYHPQTGWFAFNFNTATDYFANMSWPNPAGTLDPGSGSGWVTYSTASLSRFGQGGGLVDLHVYDSTDGPGAIYPDSRVANWNFLTNGAGNPWSRSQIFAYEYGLAIIAYNQNTIYNLTVLDVIIDYFKITVNYVSPATYFISASSTGTITVNKVVTPTDPIPTFDLQINGSLSPATFSLQNGDSQAFASVPVGSGYEVTETPDPDYTTTIEVSNGSPSDDISVGVGEDVVVTVTNSSKSSGSGLFKLTLSAVNPPPITDDTYLDANNDEVNVKIPWYIETGLLLPEE